MFPGQLFAGQNTLTSSNVLRKLEAGRNRSLHVLLPRFRHKMRLSPALRTAAVRLTLFTRANCGLCEVAKSRIVELQKKRPVEYSEVDIMAAGQEKWRDVYDFDVPVLHVDKVASGEDTAMTPTFDAARKLMHRFTVEDVEKAIYDAEGTST